MSDATTPRMERRYAAPADAEHDWGKAFDNLERTLAADDYVRR